MTAPREILPGRTYLITRRCTQRQFLLRPDEQTNAIFSYCLGYAADKYGMELVAWDAMSNHYHAVVHDPLGKLPAFLEHFHKMVARAMNARWKRWENFWSTEQTGVTYLPTLEAVLEKVCYVLANPMNAHLVDRQADWPGASSMSYLDGRRVEHDRPLGFFRPDGPTPPKVELFATQPPCSKATESAEEWAARVRAAVEEAERTARAARLSQNIRLQGRKAVLRALPTDSPNTPAPHRKLRPTIASRNAEVRREEIARLADFRCRHEEARRRFINGDHLVMFPAGTYRLRALGARCAPYPDEGQAEAA